VNVRGMVKAAAAGLCRTPGAYRVVTSVTGRSAAPLVLAYHRVVDRFEEHARRVMPSLLVSTTMLERQLDWVGRRYRIVSLDELAAVLEAGAPAAGLAAVSFDDGYQDVYHHALPLLRRKGIPGAVFVVTDLVGTRRLALHDRMYRLVTRGLARGPARGAFDWLAALGSASSGHRDGDVRGDALVRTRQLLAALTRQQAEDAAGVLEAELGLPDEDLTGMLPLDWEMLGDLRRAGWTIGSHTRRHALLTREPLLCLREELNGSRTAIERRLGAACDHFAYPDGRWNPTVVRAVAASGYRFAYSSCRHQDAMRARLTIRRTPLWERAAADGDGRFSPAVMSGLASGLFGLVGQCRLHESDPTF